jgi:hypothetical protein
VVELCILKDSPEVHGVGICIEQVMANLNTRLVIFYSFQAVRIPLLPQVKDTGLVDDTLRTIHDGMTGSQLRCDERSSRRLCTWSGICDRQQSFAIVQQLK